MYKEKRMERAEGTTTIAILLRTASRDAAYIKVIVIRQTEYKDLPGKSPVIHVTARSIITPQFYIGRNTEGFVLAQIMRSVSKALLLEGDVEHRTEI